MNITDLSEAPSRSPLQRQVDRGQRLARNDIMTRKGIPAFEQLDSLAKPCRGFSSAVKRTKGERDLRGNILAQLLLLGAVVSTHFAALAQAASEADQIRDELRQLKQEYQQRIDRLEERLRKLETAPAATNPATPSSVSTGKTAETAQSTNAAAAARQFANEQFRPGTEWREGILMESPFRERIEQVLQEFVEFHGYFRAGYGRDDKGGPQVGFQAPGALSKYRLGNEAENYGEIMFGKNFYVPNLFGLDAGERPDRTPTGPIARVETMISFYNPYQDLLSSGNTSFGLPELFASIGNVVADQPSMKFWAGSRYYRRQDIHISDFFFYNMSGTGGGVEDFELPFGKIALAWIGAASSSGFSDLPQPDAQNKAGFSKANWDLRLYDVSLPLGKGEFSVVYAREDSGLDASGRSVPGSDGAAVTFLHTAEQFISPDGFNKFSLQFGTGPAKTFTSGFETFLLPQGLFIRPDARNSWRFRATEHFVADVSERFSVGPALVYQLTDYGDEGGGLVHWGSAGVRPILRFNKYISLALEGGVDWVKNTDLETSDYLWKVTLAPQVSLGSRFFSRPVIRAFVTYAHWGEDFKGQVGGNDYLNDNNGLTYGVQMEAWW
jgi:maltoporin